MENTKRGDWIPKDVREDVIKEFHRLKAKHPSLEGDALWAMSRDYVWTVALADTAIFKARMGL